MLLAQTLYISFSFFFRLTRKSTDGNEKATKNTTLQKIVRRGRNEAIRRIKESKVEKSTGKTTFQKMKYIKLLKINCEG